jgi:predicted transcriptional regulator
MTRRHPGAADHQRKGTDMARQSPNDGLSRRERQVMDILHRKGDSTVAEIMQAMPDPPTYSAVRSILRILSEKNLISHREDGPRYVYFPARPTDKVGNDALAHVVRTYFAGSPEEAVTALLRLADTDLDEAELARLRRKIRRARLGEKETE